ncbi:MAG: Ppx/GppA family phosphatase [Deltaproteobacteria bacterium]|nr:Ppx/GppA family phosphatase [Deltaproteobacteria bacterium]
MERIAIIDLGSNAGRMAVFAFEPGQRFMQVDQLRQTVRLASGPGDDKIIRGGVFHQGIEVLKAFRIYCDASQIPTIVPVATSAVRDAANGEGFVAAARERAGVELQILSGHEEARLGVLAVANSHAYTDALVLDVGGGSAQLSLMEGRTFMEGTSWPLGGVRMTDAFIKSDPPKPKELKAIEAYVAEKVAGRLSSVRRGLPLIGMGGTIRNLARIHQAHVGYPVPLLHGYRLEADVLDALVEELASLTTSARADLSGLNRDRADVVVAAAVVVRTMVRLAGADALVVSSHGLREGLLYERMWPDQPGHLVPDVRAFSVLNMARRYCDQPGHTEHVRKLSLQLFDQLQPWHGYGAAERDLLGCAATLHDIGMAVDYFEHHTHGQFLTMASEMPGFTHREQALVALLVGGHRKGRPGSGALAPLLAPGDDERVGKLAGMLRLAEYLERTKAQRVQDVRCHLGAGYLQVEALAKEEASVEIQAANQRSDLLARSFGVKVEVVLGVA